MIRLYSILILSCFLLGACSSSGYRSNGYGTGNRGTGSQSVLTVKQGSSLPKEFQLALYTEEWEIQSYRILSDIDDLPDFYMDKRYEVSDNLTVLRLQPIGVKGSWVYFARVKPVKNGQTLLDAKLYEYPFPTRKLPPPPKQIEISIEARNNQILTNQIENVSESTFGLYRDGIKATRRGVLFTIKSQYYKGAEWKGLYPMKNGYHTIFAKLQ